RNCEGGRTERAEHAVVPKLWGGGASVGREFLPLLRARTEASRLGVMLGVKSFGLSLMINRFQTMFL
ncbi:MAG: hypothetical protein CMJ70_13105, partial [Planctomycetaceae bacterium]|nr:hypothetical protein [Planctomycetaceae bacterium]